MLKREVAADITSFVGFKGAFNGSSSSARKYRMNLIYDSSTFNPNEAFSFLESLQNKSAYSAKQVILNEWKKLESYFELK